MKINELFAYMKYDIIPLNLNPLGKIYVVILELCQIIKCIQFNNIVSYYT